MLLLTHHQWRRDLLGFFLSRLFASPHIALVVLSFWFPSRSSSIFGAFQGGSSAERDGPDDDEDVEEDEWDCLLRLAFAFDPILHLPLLSYPLLHRSSPNPRAALVLR